MLGDGVEVGDEDLLPGSWDSIAQRHPAVLLQYFLEDLNTFQVEYLFNDIKCSHGNKNLSS